jgi:hypothetical protein
VVQGGFFGATCAGMVISMMGTESMEEVECWPPFPSRQQHLLATARTLSSSSSPLPGSGRCLHLCRLSPASTPVSARGSTAPCRTGDQGPRVLLRRRDQAEEGALAPLCCRGASSICRQSSTMRGEKARACSRAGRRGGAPRPTPPWPPPRGLRVDLERERERRPCI